ncbi:MAG: hypothetical protein GY838_03715 [bacterium]|nr:hypothetical protein [bacterium]
MPLQILDTENADRNLTSKVTVLTDTPVASEHALCQALVMLGDGSKNLDGSGGDFELTVTVDGQTAQPAPQVVTFGTEVRATVWSTPFPVPSNKEVTVAVKSPNGADTDVDVTAHLFRLDSPVVLADAATHGGSTATLEVESLTAESITARASTGLADSAMAINTTATSDTVVTTGSETLTYTATAVADGSYHEVAVDGTIDMYYAFQIGENTSPTSVKWRGYVQTEGDKVEVSAWNSVDGAWDQIGEIDGVGAGLPVSERTFDLTDEHVSTGGTTGLVLLRFSSDGGDVATNLATDRVLCGYMPSKAAVAALQTDLDTITDDGVDLTATGLDAIATTEPSGVAGTFREMVVQTWRRFFKATTATATELKTYKDDDSVATTQVVSEGTTDSIGDAS